MVDEQHRFVYILVLIETCPVAPFSRYGNIDVIDILLRTCQRWISLSYILLHLSPSIFYCTTFVFLSYSLISILKWSLGWIFSFDSLTPMTDVSRIHSCGSFTRASFIPLPTCDARSTSLWRTRPVLLVVQSSVHLFSAEKSIFCCATRPQR